MSISKLAALVAVLLLGISLNAAAQKNPAMASDAKAVDNACQAEAQAAGCGQEVVGKGLLKCMGAYRKEHKDFKVSDGCRASIKKLHDDHKASSASTK